MTDQRKDDIDDDELGLDESLSSMRSMFREMRDEEPSDKGMAALLAAAREKADEMKPKRSWLAVLLDLLRRPPVLAMATVVVLIGGAVVISKRDTRTEIEQTSGEVARYDDGTLDKNVAAPPPPARDEVVGGAPGNANERERTEGGTSGSAAVAEPAPVVTQSPRPAANKSRVLKAKKPPAGDGVAFTPKAPAEEAAPETKKEDAKPPMAIATGDDEYQSKGAAAPEMPTTAPQTDQKQVTRKPLPSIEGEDRRMKDSSIAELLKQCEAAAAKSDCAAVRTIASKIAKQDPQTYKNRVLKNAKIAQCLEPAPLEVVPAPAD